MAEILSKKDTTKIIELLKKGKVGIVPTDTVYGFIANAFCKRAVKRIYKIKRRPPEKTFLLIIHGKNMLSTLISSEFKIPEIVKKKWPGKFTFLFPASKSLPAYLQKEGKVAIREPNNLFLQKIIDGCGFPLVAPSANLSGLPVISKFEELKKEFMDKVDFIVDGGDLGARKPSKLIDITSSPYKVLRK